MLILIIPVLKSLEMLALLFFRTTIKISEDIFDFWTEAQL